MLEFILANHNVPFTVAIGLMVGIALLEVVSLLLGFALSGVVDNALPDFDLDADLDGVPDHPHVAAAAHWLHVGEAPSLVLLILGLLGFGLAGWAVQYGSVLNFKQPLSLWLAVPAALTVAVFTMRAGGGLLAKIGFRDETTAVSADSLVGGTAFITLGTARRGEPSQAKIQDKHGLTHYVLVEPLRPGEEFPHGAAVTLIRRDGPKYYVVEDSVDALLTIGSEDLSAENRQKA